MLKEITLEKATDLYNKGHDIYLADANDTLALPWNNRTDALEFVHTLGFFSKGVRCFLAFNNTDTSNI